MSEPGQRLRPDEAERLLRSYQDLKELAANCEAPSVRAAARAALAQLHTALSGQGLGHEFYSSDWSEEPPGPSGARESGP
jgi:Family of unknown function (DUF6052)